MKRIAIIILLFSISACAAERLQSERDKLGGQPEESGGHLVPTRIWCQSGMAQSNWWATSCPPEGRAVFFGVVLPNKTSE